MPLHVRADPSLLLQRGRSCMQAGCFDCSEVSLCNILAMMVVTESTTSLTQRYMTGKGLYQVMKWLDMLCWLCQDDCPLIGVQCNEALQLLAMPLWNERVYTWRSSALRKNLPPMKSPAS